MGRGIRASDINIFKNPYKDIARSVTARYSEEIMIIRKYEIKLFGRDMLAWGDENRVFAISLFSDSAIDSKLARFTDIIETGEHCDIIPTSLKQYESTGSVENLKPVILWGTPFQRKVWEELYRLPAGKLISYGELAAKIGRPRAARAVGSAGGAGFPLQGRLEHRIAGEGDTVCYGEAEDAYGTPGAIASGRTDRIV